MVAVQCHESEKPIVVLIKGPSCLEPECSDRNRNQGRTVMSRSIIIEGPLRVEP